MSSDSIRLLNDSPLPGPWNMAVDEALLAAAAENPLVTLRFYGWVEPTLSLGYFQAYDERDTHPASRQAAIVRRQSGGGAILHDRELTYSLTLPVDHPAGRDAHRLYEVAHQSLVALLQQELTAAGVPWRLELNESPPPPSNHAEPFLCFERRAPLDVLLVPTDSGGPTWKIAGSAQRRRRGAILQHGSVLLHRSPAAPELPGFCDLTGIAITVDRLSEQFAAALAAKLELHITEFPLPASVEIAARSIEREKYAHNGWTHRR